MKIIKCFVASPGDTAEERASCDAVFTRINRELGDLLGIRIESKKWENDVYPSFGADSQTVIDNQIGDDYHLFVGMMWQKFGTPTSRYGSGTEQEFENAYKRYANKEDLELMIYFNKRAPENLNDIDVDSLMKVRAFKEKVASLGGLYWDYEGPDDFPKQLESHLKQLLIRKYSPQSLVQQDVVQESKPNVDEKTKSKLEALFSQNLEDALSIFSSQPRVWVDPILRAYPENSPVAFQMIMAQTRCSSAR